MNTLNFGFGETDITPSEPTLLAGYYYDRLSTGVHDRLAARSMAVSDGKTCAVLCMLDLICLAEPLIAKTQRLLREKGMLSPENLLLAAIHSHTAPDIRRETAYAAGLPAQVVESVRLALDDLSPRDAKIASGKAPDLQFIRRYRMKDGSVVTNPGILNPDVVAPIGKPDPEVLTLLVSETERTVGGFVNFGLHCDTVGGTKVSADWTHYLRQALSKELNISGPLLTPIACCGDVNHWNVFKRVTSRRFEETERIGVQLAKDVLTSLPSAEPIHASPVRALKRNIQLNTSMPTENELVAAKKIMARPERKDVDFELDRVIATRQLRVAEIGPTLSLTVGVITFGEVALVGIPAEYFSALGRDIKARSPFHHTAIITLADRTMSYIGGQRNYEEGGYEMVSSIVIPGAGEQIADTAVELLKQAHATQE